MHIRTAGYSALKAYRYDGSYGEVDDTDRIVLAIFGGILAAICCGICICMCPTLSKECDFFTIKTKKSGNFRTSIETQMEEYHMKQSIIAGYERSLTKGKRGLD